MTDRCWTEAERLAILHGYNILDTEAEPAFDDVVGLIRTICNVPIALVSLVDTDRQWFKAKTGVDAEQTDINTSVCALAIQQDDIFIIEDLSTDPRTADMSLVTDDPRIRFYAGVPLVTSQNIPLGSLCVIDLEPRPGGLDPEQTRALAALGRQVVALIELRTAVEDRERALAEQEQRQVQAERDAAILKTMMLAQQRAMQAGSDFDTLLQALVDAALDAVSPADGVVIEMRDGDSMVYRSGSGTAAGRTGLRFPIATSFSGRAFVEETALIIADVTTDSRADLVLVDRLGIRSLVAVPLTRHGEVFGVLKLHSAAPNAFRSRHVLIGQLLAGLIASSFSESAEAEALRSVEQTQQGYRHIVDSAVDSGIISTDEAGLITSWSKGAETIMGWTEAEVLGQSLDLIFTPEDRAAGRLSVELARAKAEGRASDERWHMRKNGDRYYAHGAVTPLLGPGTGFVKSLRDVTEEHATRTAFEAGRARLDAALDTGLIGFFSWDVATSTITGDSRFAEFYGLDRDAVERGVPQPEAMRNILDVDLPGLNGEIEANRSRCADYVHSYRTVRKDGGIRWVRIHGRCMEQADGKPLLYVGTAVDVTKQREAEEDLILSRERLELATRAAQLGSFDYFPEKDSLYWDDRCRALFGMSPGAPVTYETAFLAGLHPEDRDMAAAAVTASLDPKGNGTFDIEYRTIGIEDGVERAILAKGLATFENGVPQRLIGTVQDVTEDRLARRHLRETEERFRLAVRATNDAIWDWDLVRDHVLWNDALQTTYGHSLTEIETNGAWWLANIHPEDGARVSASIHAVIDGTETDWTDDYRFRRADGSYADVRDRGYVLRDAEGRAVRMIGAVHDQSDRIQIERDLQQLNESLTTSVSARTEELDRLWATSPDLLLMLSFDGLIQRVNPAWTNILGYGPEELLGREIQTLVVTDDVDLTLNALDVASSGPLPTMENRYRHKDGSIRWFSWVAAPTGTEIYATGRHITADKEAEIALRNTEEQLRQAQKVEAIGQLTGGVAHDFNNLLTVIRGSVDLLRRPDISEEKRLRYINAISDTSDRAIKLTAQLLAFARRSTLKPEVFDVGAGILALRDMMGTLSGSMIRVNVEVAPEPCFIDADPSQFDTAIVNMAVNARDAMNRQGQLDILVAGVGEMPAIRHHPRIVGDFVAVSVRDTGSGIPADKIDHIFEPFFTTKAVGEGTGLGLSQVFGFAKQSGGEIKVESREGEGTTFTLYLPRVSASGRISSGAAPEPVERSKGSCILVVEDNEDVGAFAIQALAELGHFTVLARDGRAALEILAGNTTTFDAVFSDVVMPGMTGIEMGHEIRRLHPGMPVLLTSGYSSVLAEEGTHGFQLLHKPYSLDELSQALQRISALIQTGDPVT